MNAANLGRVVASAEGFAVTAAARQGPHSFGLGSRSSPAKIRRWPTTAKAFAGKVRNEAEESDD
jgi:hypothetical protein